MRTLEAIFTPKATATNVTVAAKQVARVKVNKIYGGRNK